MPPWRLAEWLAITYGDQGLRVSCLCPQLVRTDMLAGADRSHQEQGSPTSTSSSPKESPTTVVDGLREERFLILPHPEVADYFRRKAADYDRWLAGMRRLAGSGG